MKNTAYILLTLAVLLSLCSCANGEISGGSDSQNSETDHWEASETEMTEKAVDTVNIKIGDQVFTAQLYDNKTAKAFADMLPLTLNMSELNANEKYYNLNQSLPTDSTEIGSIKSGDIMLYGSNCVVLFYDSFQTQYSYTKIGFIENTYNLAEAVGNGNITITFEK